MEHAIILKDVEKIFGTGHEPRVRALARVSLAIGRGEFFVLVGPSGCGKSTLLRIMSGLEMPNTGRVSFGKELGSRDVSFVFQQFALLPWLTVAENIGLGLVARGVARAAVKRQVAPLLEEFGLTKFAHTYPRDLSGGMRQRVGIARALATNPKILFMDEPFSELDSFTARELRKELLRIWAERKITIIMVTHIVEEAIELANRVAVMTPRPGKIEKIVPIALSRPRNERSSEFFALEDELDAIIRP